MKRRGFLQALLGGATLAALRPERKRSLKIKVVIENQAAFHRGLRNAASNAPFQMMLTGLYSRGIQ